MFGCIRTMRHTVPIRLRCCWQLPLPRYLADIENSVVTELSKACKSSMSAMLLLLLIALFGTWMISGVVPAMVYYGLDLLNPTIFLAASVIIRSIVSVATGSSWSTIATVGVALLGIGSCARSRRSHHGGSHHFRSLFRRQDFAPIRYNKPCVGDGRQRPVRSYQVHATDYYSQHIDNGSDLRRNRNDG